MEHLKLFHPPLQSYNIYDSNNRQEELVKLMVQTLENLGYKKSAQKLLEESNVRFENPALLNLRTNISEGKWNEAIEALEKLKLTKEQLEKAQFLIYEQKYIEMIIEKKYNQALVLLREEITKRAHEPERLHKLAGLMICLNQRDVEKKLNKSANYEEARKNLLNELQETCKPTDMMSANRFEKLLQHAMNFQALECKFHKSIDKDFSLMEDHTCEMERIPTRTVVTKSQHLEEIWIVKFSNNGALLATVAKNTEMFVWEFNENTLDLKLKYKNLRTHEREVNCLNWSRDDKKILTASYQTLKLWDSSSGQLILIIKAHVDLVYSAAWLPDNEHFISGGIDNYLLLWNLQGERVAQIKSLRVLDLLVSSNGNMIYAVCAGVPTVCVIDFVKKKERYQIKEKDKICSASLSKDDKFLLLNISISQPELHLWSLDKYELIQVYTGHFQCRFRISCCFGGPDDTYIACGGEDGTLKIWHRNFSEPVEVLRGHFLTVNTVAWHPKNPLVLISGSDDRTLRIWSTEENLGKVPRKLAKKVLWLSPLKKFNFFWIKYPPLAQIHSRNQNRKVMKKVLVTLGIISVSYVLGFLIKSSFQ